MCPASLRLNWEREIWAWSTIPNVSTYPVLKSSDGVSLDANYVIISYALLANKSILDAILDVMWDHVILDEAHAIKDPKGNTRTRAICAPDCIPSVAGRITLASGTILPNQPIECLGPDTLVLTNGGWRAIIDVSDNDLLWDGVEWVRHSGLVYRGGRETMKICGVEMTPDHETLVGGAWSPAHALAACEYTMSRALETGLASLLSLASTEDLGAVWRQLGCGALAAPTPTECTRTSSARDRVLGAAGATSGSPIGSETQRTADYALTKHSVDGACSAFINASRDATTPNINLGLATAGEGYQFSASGEKGEKADESSSLTSWGSQDGTIGPSNWTGSTSTEGTNLGICGASLSLRTRGIEDQSGNCRRESLSLRPVYDLVNAGPRQRFTILSNAGPLVVHNCYNAVRLLNWDAIDRMSLEAFREHYYDLGGGMVRGPVYDPATQAWSNKLHWSEKVRNVPRNLDELQRRLRKHIMVRRLKEQVLHELPPKQWHTFPMEVTSEMRRALKHPGWAIASKLYEMDADAFNDGIPVDGAISTARKMLGEAKMPSVAAYVEDLLESGVDKLVVTAWHTSVLHYLRDKLSKYGLVYMDGSTSAAKKQLAVDQFQSQEKTRIILGQTAVIGEGWTLTQAQDVVLAEPDWVPGRNDQALDRIHRKGQTGDRVIGHIPVVPGTLDERVMSTAIRKDVAIYQALDHKHSI